MTDAAPTRSLTELPVQSHAHADACAHGTCGCSAPATFSGTDPRYRLMLWIVIAINGVMFLVEMLGGRLAGSQALQADALDFLGDTLTYGLSLAVIGRPQKVRSSAALAKAVSLLAMGAWVFGATIYRLFVLGLPSAGLMGGIGTAAFVANVASVLLLVRYKDGDANVRSVWLCSRNDAIGNVVVVIAASGVWATSTAWPDLIVAAIMAGLFVNSAQQILRLSIAELRSGRDAGALTSHGHDHGDGEPPHGHHDHHHGHAH